MPSAPTAVNLKFYDAYRDQYKKEPNQFAAQAYAGAQVVAEAVRRAGLTGAEDIGTQRSKIAEALRTIKSIETPLGRIGFTATRDGNPKTVIPNRAGAYGWERNAFVNRIHPTSSTGFSAGSSAPTAPGPWARSPTSWWPGGSWRARPSRG